MKNLSREHRFAMLFLVANTCIAFFTAVFFPSIGGLRHATWIWSIHALHLLVFVIALTQATVLFRNERARKWLFVSSANVVLFIAAISRGVWLIDHSLRAQ